VATLKLVTVGSVAQIVTLFPLRLLFINKIDCRTSETEIYNYADFN